ncbi:arginine--tRNA ligase [Candidatus Omnitrophota bacterium]
MTRNVRKACESALEKALQKVFPRIPKQKNLSKTLDIPKNPTHGDASSNIALQLAREVKEAPLSIAQKLHDELQSQTSTKLFSKIEVKPPGFINFFLSSEALFEAAQDVLSKKERYAQTNAGKGKKIQIEFVSANPTGPLSVAHARQAAVGDALGNILQFLGYKVTKEFYVNDEGNQINVLGASIKRRAQQQFMKTPMADEMYQGEYIKEIAAQFMKDNNIKSEKDLEGKDEDIARYGVEYLLNVIKQELQDFGVHFDVWSFQSHIATAPTIEAALKDLEEKGFLYHKDGALWFESTRFGDDKPRVVKKSDGNFTYLAPDIVYHKNKYDRGFDTIINMWGPDHHGYIPRIKAAAEALGHCAESLEVKIVQLATIYRDGQPVSMSTRRGQFITLREVIDEVGVDAARFFFLMRRLEAHLDFDLELAKKQTPENPVFYIQYAHARIASIKKKAIESKKCMAKKIDATLLTQPEELKLAKLLGQFPSVLETSAVVRDPYGVVNFLQELATAFHSFYDKHRVISDEDPLTQSRLALVEAVRIVLALGLTLLGTSVPETM